MGKTLKQIVKLIQNKPPFMTSRYGIHGRAHANRVLLFANLISVLAQERLNEPLDLKAITIAALLHDCGRSSDGSDSNHADKSAELASEFIQKNKIECNGELISKIIRRHCPSEDFKWDNPTVEAKIMGDADKLDRFRFHRQKRPLKIEWLEIPESLEIIDIASRVNGHSFRTFK